MVQKSERVGIFSEATVSTINTQFENKEEVMNLCSYCYYVTESSSVISLFFYLTVSQRLSSLTETE